MLLNGGFRKEHRLEFEEKILKFIESTQGRNLWRFLAERFSGRPSNHEELFAIAGELFPEHSELLQVIGSGDTELIYGKLIALANPVYTKADLRPAGGDFIHQLKSQIIRGAFLLDRLERLAGLRRTEIFARISQVEPQPAMTQ